MTWFRLPLFVWSHYATSLIMILGTPVIAITVLLVAAERVLHLGIFDPALGGDPILFQHLFWFYSHPAVYIMILPAMGVISEVVAGVLAQERLRLLVRRVLVAGDRHHRVPGLGAPPVRLGPVGVRGADVLGPELPRRDPVGGQGVQLDGHDLQGLGQPAVADALRVRLHRPVHDRRADGLFLAALGLDMHVHDTYFVVAHFHYIMVGGAIMGYLGGLHYWWPKITGRMYPEGWAKFAALVVFVGFNLTFFPQFLVGYLGHAAPLPRVPAGVPGVQRAVHGGRDDARRSATCCR